MQRRSRCRRRRQLRARAEPARLDQGRRPQRRRQRSQRRRPGDRSLADARRPRRSFDADGAGTGRRDLGRHGSGGAALRTRCARRGRLDDRNRRPDPARRGRPPAPQARALDRQPPLGRHRHRGRAIAKGERNRERGPLLGRTRRGQQLRSRHVVRVPGAPGWPDGDGRRGLLPAGGGEGNRARVARLRGLGARGAELDRAVLERSTARAVSARAPRQARRGRRRRLLGIGRRRRAGRAALARAGGAADRPERPVALARPAERFRCALSQGSVLLLEIAGLRRAA